MKQDFFFLESEDNCDVFTKSFPQIGFFSSMSSYTFPDIKMIFTRLEISRAVITSSLPGPRPDF